MAKDRVQADWMQIEPESLNGEAAKLYAGYKAQYRLAKEAKGLFEAEMQELAGLPEGQKMIFGYNFGKLSVAIVPDDRPQAKAKQATVSLSAWLAAQAVAGNRV